MASDEEEHDARARAVARLRREPPRFRRVQVKRTAHLSPRLIRVTLGGPELQGLAVDQPAASVRVLLPPPGEDELVMPEWTGNEFLLPGGRRPVIRTLTPRYVREHERELDVDIVVHGGGTASTWAAGAKPGAPAAVSGPGRGYAVDGDIQHFVLAGDETALPAISQLLEALPASSVVDVHVEIASADARLPLPDHPRCQVTWHALPEGEAPGAALVAAVTGASIPGGAKVWVAGEAASVQRIRGHLFSERGLSRRDATVRGYWKHGRTSDDAGDGDDG